MNGLTRPQNLVKACLQTHESRVWLERLPEVLHHLQSQWSLVLGEPFTGDDVSCSWVAPVRCSDGSDAVLKLGMPHMEGRHEIEGLRFWNGNPTAKILDFDIGFGAMLLEHCKPGTSLRALPEPEQDHIIARLLNRLWRVPQEPHPFRPLSAMIAYWSEATLADAEKWLDPGLVREGLHLFQELSNTTAENVLLATDLHAGNVLRAEREHWLVIDPKPFVGDPAYDATQHLFNCATRLHSDPKGMIHRFSDLLGMNPERVRLWMFARAASEPREQWGHNEMIELASVIAP